MMINLVREKQHIWYDDNYIVWKRSSYTIIPFVHILVLGFRGDTWQSNLNVNCFIIRCSLGNRKQAYACERKFFIVFLQSILRRKNFESKDDII